MTPGTSGPSRCFRGIALGRHWRSAPNTPWIARAYMAQKTLIFAAFLSLFGCRHARDLAAPRRSSPACRKPLRTQRRIVSMRRRVGLGRRLPSRRAPSVRQTLLGTRFRLPVSRHLDLLRCNDIGWIVAHSQNGSIIEAERCWPARRCSSLGQRCQDSHCFS